MALPGLIPSQMQSVQAENLRQEETPVVPTDPTRNRDATFALYPKLPNPRWWL